MAYRWLPTKEGGYHRTGSRTPMQWDNGKNLGFSDGREEDLYLPVDPNPNGATVESQEDDLDSMLHFIRGLIYLRQNHEDLGNYSSFQVYHNEDGDRLFAYKRGNYLLAVNPGVEAKALKLDGKYRSLYSFGNAELGEETVTMQSQSFIVLRPAE